MVCGSRGGGECVRLAVKFLRDDTDQFLVDALRAEVASDFLNAEETWLGRDAALDVGPQVSVRAVRRWGAVPRG